MYIMYIIYYIIYKVLLAFHKMRPEPNGILEMTFSNAYSWKRIFQFDSDFTCVYFWRSCYLSLLVYMKARIRSGAKPLFESILARFTDLKLRHNATVC